MRKIPTARSSRRAPGLKDSDYDHEIALVDHAAEAVGVQPQSQDLAAQSEQAHHALNPSRTADTDRALSKYTTATSSHPSPSLTEAGPSSDRNHISGSGSNHSASSDRTSVRSRSSKGSLSKPYKPRDSVRKNTIPRVEVEGEESCCPFQRLYCNV